MDKKNEVFNMRLSAHDKRVIQYLAALMQRTPSDALRIIANEKFTEVQAQINQGSTIQQGAKMEAKN